MNYIDFILIGIVLLYALLSLRKGLLRSIIELAGYLVAVPAAVLAGNTFSGRMYERFFHQRLVDSTANAIAQSGNPADYVERVRDGLNSSSFTSDLLNQFGIDLDGFLARVAGSTDASHIADSVVTYVMKPAITAVCGALIFVAVFLLIIILVKVASLLLRKVRLPGILGSVNGLLGAVFGGLRGIVMVLFLCTFLSSIQVASGAMQTQNSFLEACGNSAIIQLIGEINPIAVGNT
ncbi:MAG: CvpA family protein [Clostridiales bacterium]|nr:CvpA family protein [Clostridiales bacterium]